MAADETVTKLIGLFVYHRSRGVDNAQVIPKLYQAHVAQLLLNSNEEVYRLQLLASQADLSTGSHASIVACTCLGHLYTPNASTVSEMAKQQELVLEDVEEEEEDKGEEGEDHRPGSGLGMGEYEGESAKAADGHTSDQMLTQDEEEEGESDSDLSGAEDGTVGEEDPEEDGEEDGMGHGLESGKASDGGDALLQEILNATKEVSPAAAEDAKQAAAANGGRAKRARR